MADVKLVTVENQIEADILASMLLSEGICSRQQVSDSGNYMERAIGMDMFEVDIYTMQEDYEMAKAIADIFVEKSACHIEQKETREVREESEIYPEKQKEKKLIKRNGIMQRYATCAGALSSVGIAGIMCITKL